MEKEILEFLRDAGEEKVISLKSMKKIDDFRNRLELVDDGALDEELQDIIEMLKEEFFTLGKIYSDLKNSRK